MIKDFFSNRLFIGALAFFILTVGGSLLYMQHVERQTARELAAHKAHLKQFTEKQKPKPTAEVAKVSETPQQDGHFHADGTWHEGPHETPEQPTRQAHQLQEYAEYIPAHLLEAQSLVSVDMERARAAFRDALPEDPFSAEFEKAVKDNVQRMIDLHPGIYDLPPGHPRRVEYAITKNLSVAAFGVATKLFGNYDDRSSARAREIGSWKEPYYALFTNPTQHEEEENR